MIPSVTAMNSARRLMSDARAPQAQRSTNEDLLRRVQRLELLLETLLLVMMEKKLLHEDEFKQWMDYVDQLDGVADGRIREVRAPSTCPACHRNNSPEAAVCQYCGAKLERNFLLSNKGAQPADE